MTRSATILRATVMAPTRGGLSGPAAAPDGSVARAVTLPGLDRPRARAVVAGARARCALSSAPRSNIDAGLRAA
jgi:organic hydroperoxide reductase OsmC/OhrA